MVVVNGLGSDTNAQRQRMQQSQRNATRHNFEVSESRRNRVERVDSRVRCVDTKAPSIRTQSLLLVAL